MIRCSRPVFRRRVVAAELLSSRRGCRNRPSSADLPACSGSSEYGPRIYIVSRISYGFRQTAMINAVDPGRKTMDPGGTSSSTRSINCSCRSRTVSRPASNRFPRRIPGIIQAMTTTGTHHRFTWRRAISSTITAADIVAAGNTGMKYRALKTCFVPYRNTV